MYSVNVSFCPATPPFRYAHPRQVPPRDHSRPPKPEDWASGGASSIGALVNLEPLYSFATYENTPFPFKQPDWSPVSETDSLGQICLPRSSQLSRGPHHRRSGSPRSPRM